MRRRPTIHEQVWPKDSSFDSLRAWPANFGVQVLERVWEAFDNLQVDVIQHVSDWNDLEHVERSLTDLHFDKIIELQSGEEPFLPTREVPDFESRTSASAEATSEACHSMVMVCGVTLTTRTKSREGGRFGF